MKKTKILFIIIFEIAAAFGIASAQTSIGAKLKEVRVYFLYLGTDGTESKILPLKRKVSAAQPLQTAIEELIKEPTVEEQKRGFATASYGEMKLVSVKIKKGIARIDFSRPIRDDYNPGDLQTLDFESAVVKTVKQFPTVKKVVVCVNGINEFGIGLVENAPRPCPIEN